MKGSATPVGLFRGSRLNRVSAKDLSLFTTNLLMPDGVLGNGCGLMKGCSYLAFETTEDLIHSLALSSWKSPILGIAGRIKKWKRRTDHKAEPSL